MISQETIQDIKSLQTHFNAIWSSQTLKLGSHEVELIGRVYKQITAPGKRLNLACAECVRNALAFIAVWWQENSSNYETTNIKKKK